MRPESGASPDDIEGGSGKLNLAILIACGVPPTQARRFVGPLSVFPPRFGITGPARFAAFIAECGYESAFFTTLEEDLYYRTAARIREVWPEQFRTLAAAMPFVKAPKALANRVYAGQNGNGDTASGDGWLFRGRGPIQLTGRANYLAMGLLAGRDWIATPEDLLMPPGAIISACAYWQSHGCNELADALDINGLTRRINGRAMRGAMERKRLYRQAYEACCDAAIPERRAA